jgi:hypothetical protein
MDLMEESLQMVLGYILMKIVKLKMAWYLKAIKRSFKLDLLGQINE